MNYPFWDVEVGCGVLIALISVVHVFVSHFAIGGGLYLVLSERSARRRGDDQCLGFVQRLSRFFALTTVVFGALHFFIKRKYAVSGAMLFVSLLGMVVIRYIVRLLKLEGFHEPASVPLHPQWGVFLLFLALFIIALGVSGYMLKLYFAPQRSESAG